VRVAVTGVTGRLGSAVLRLARSTGHDAIGWERGEFDLDAPDGITATLDRDRPDVVVHCAAWTDVDGCAREPDLAEARNGRATGVLARACEARGIGLAAISTNEVFDGARSDQRPYAPDDPTAPGNAYGRSKLVGETEAREAFGGASSGGPLWIVRTAWLFGAPGRDFPIKIIDAARKAEAAGESLRLVADEIGTPTLASDLAAGVLDLIAEPASAGVHHVVNAGRASRADWARRVLAEADLHVRTEDVPMSTWQRPSQPPLWGVMAPTTLPTIGLLRPWEDALAADLRERGLAAASRTGA
jgi:dTDP-4-dehydrorhamnose reductase